jgi:AcrR family transcriptional regulator
MPRRSARDILLDAAEALVGLQGAAHLTLDAVSERAGLSKGGLLYHFPCKEALLEAMIDRQLRRHEHDQSAIRDRLPRSRWSDLEAVIRAAFRSAARPERVSAALLAAGANDPGLLAPVRRMHRRQFAALTRGARNPPRVQLLLLALDGLWLNAMLRTLPLSGPERARLERECVELAMQVS